ncbi:MAG: Zinc ribbon domain protein [Syntrophaceae bacterium PtaB.Bin095]|nr:MAG: Zinc ribbon domain protein [Syntrophaceae bacterium PtaB.Bin095]
MPIHEYRCDRCGAVFERIEGFDAEGPGCCNACESRRLTRMLPRGVRSMGTRIPAGRSGSTCCGREESCERPPCGEGGGCRR